MKEICFDARMCSKTGIGVYIRNILEQLKKSSFKMRVLIKKEDVEKWKFLKEFDPIIVKSDIYSVQEQLELPLKIPKCDIFWTPHYNVPLSGLRAKKRVVNIHDVCHLAFSHQFSLIQKMYSRIVMNQAVQRSDLIFTGSYFSKEEILKYTRAKKEKVQVIWNGVNKALFQKEGLNVLENIKVKYTLPDNFFLYVGRFSPYKNIGRLLKAFSKLKKEFPHQALVLVGSFPKEEKMREVFNKFPDLKESVYFLGFIPEEDLPSIYQLAIALIHPSLYEGFGLTPLEAMSCGCPVVVSHAASLPEICGTNAVYVDPYQEESVLEGMKKVLLDKALLLSLSQRGVDWARQFNWDQTGASYIRALELLC
mgnify:CR=1 FL=1